MAMDKIAMNDEELDQVTGGSVLHYMVQAGDTLESIAKRYKVSIDQVAKWNNITNPNYLQVGQQLKFYY